MYPVVWPNFNQNSGFLESTKSIYFSSLQFIGDNFKEKVVKLKIPTFQNRVKIILAALFVGFFDRKVKKTQKKSAKRVFLQISVY